MELVFQYGPVKLYRYPVDQIWMVGYTQKIVGLKGVRYSTDTADGILFPEKPELLRLVQEQLKMDRNISKKEQEKIPKELQVSQPYLRSRYRVFREGQFISLVGLPTVPVAQIEMLKDLYNNGRIPPVLVISNWDLMYPGIVWRENELVQLKPGDEKKTQKQILALNLSTPIRRELSALRRFPRDLAPILYQMLNVPKTVSYGSDYYFAHDFPIYRGKMELGTKCYYEDRSRNGDVYRNAARVEQLYWTVALFEVNNMQINFTQLFL